MVGVLLSSYQLYDLEYRQLAFHSNWVVYDAAQTVAHLTGPNGFLVVANDEGRLPELFYYADRNGWTTNYQQCSLTEVAAKTESGAHYVLLVLSILNDNPTEPGDWGLKLQKQFTRVSRGPYWFLYRLA